ncbi:MAG: hypothetical protein M1826_003935 [Phylliscum demangeonii]|nr:MAG: hypothetical protein M1826_003935 [Phylliscum demangeonii]
MADTTEASDATLSYAKCGQRESDASGQLKRCGKCHTTAYCSRPCQKADWKIHKKSCATLAATASSTPDTTSTSTADGAPSTSVLAAVIDKPFHQLEARAWLHDRPEADVYKLLTDALLGGATDSSRGHFRRYLSKAERQPGLLPPWWSATHAATCEREAMQEHRWSRLTSAIEKSDVIEHYGNSEIPMQLRMFAEQVYGKGPGGQSGDAMRKVMMKLEADGGRRMHASLLDVSPSFQRA